MVNDPLTESSQFDRGPFATGLRTHSPVRSRSTRTGLTIPGPPMTMLDPRTGQTVTIDPLPVRREGRA